MFRNKKMVSSVGVGLLLFTAVLGARIWKPRATKRMDATVTRETSAAAAKNGPVQVVRFTLYDAGIYPREAQVQKGLVAIMIEDLSGGTSGLVVQRMNGNARQSVGNVQRIQSHWRGRQEIQLEPGNYEVFMADRPKNKAQLTVAP